MPPRSLFDNVNDITSVVEWADNSLDDLSFSDSDSDNCHGVVVGLSATFAATSTTPQQEQQREERDDAPSKRQKRRPGVVSFVPSDDIVYDVLHVHDYTEEEKEACWYNKYDMRFFKKDAKAGATLLMMGGLSEDSTDYCRRGLEWRTPEGSRKRRQTRLTSIVAVLKEQDDLLEQYGHINDYDISQAYHSHTIQSRLEACARGVMDARDA